MNNATSQPTEWLKLPDSYLTCTIYETFMSHPRAILTDLNCDPGDNFWQAPKDAVFQKRFLRWLKPCIMPAQTDVAAGAPFTTAVSVCVWVC